MSSGRSGRGRLGGRGIRGGRAYSSPHGGSPSPGVGSSQGVGTSPSQFSGSLPASTSGTQYQQDQYQFAPRTGQTGFTQEEGPRTDETGYPQQDAQDPNSVDPSSWEFNYDNLFPDDLLHEEVEPPLTIEALLAQPGRAERLIVLNPDYDAPPHTRWPGRDSGSWISRRITQLLHKAFDGPYYSWSKFPEEKKTKLFYDFAQWYHWDRIHHGAVETMVYSTAQERLKDDVYKAKNAKARPAWIGESLWLQMREYWSSQAAKAKGEKYSANRKSDRGGIGMSKHTGGSKSFDQHETDMSIDAGRPVGISEVFRRTHTKDGKFVDGFAEQVVQTFEQAKELRLSQTDPELTSDGRTQAPVLTQNQEDEMFIQTTTSLRPKKPAFGIPKRRALSADGSGSSSRPSGWTAELTEKMSSLEDQNTQLQEQVKRMAEQQEEQLRKMAEDQEAQLRRITEEQERQRAEQARQRERDAEAMERVRMLLAHPQFASLAASLGPPATDADTPPPQPPHS